MLAIQQNVEISENTNIHINGFLSLQDDNRWFRCLLSGDLLGFLLGGPCEEVQFKRPNLTQIDRYMASTHESISDFINKYPGQASFDLVIELVDPETGNNLEFVFKNFEQWIGFYDDYLSFRSNNLTEQAVIDKHKLRVQVPRVEVLDEADPCSMDFLLQVLSHPFAPIMGAVLLLTGVAIMASGSGLVVGACVLTAGAGLTAGFAATQFGFFSDRSETEIDDGISTCPDSLRV